MQNDNNIRSLFEKEKGDAFQKEWKTVFVKDFDESVVRNVVGKRYDSLAIKTKKLLQKPGNLYIWQHLNEDETYDDCTTASHLIEKWIQQIYKRCHNVGVEEDAVRNTLEHIVDNLDKLGRLYAPKQILSISEEGYDYLVSEEMLIQDIQRVGFVHQSILDYLISKRMMQQYYAGVNIETLIGEKTKQTPGRRYQIQMFLQNLLEFDSVDFLSAGIDLLESEQIRYFIKYVFYEILGQIAEPDEKIAEFIVEQCGDENQCEYMLNNVIYGRKPYIEILRESKLLEQWFLDEKKKSAVFIVLKSISPDLESEDILFIKQRAFIKEEDDKQFAGCFLHNITQESDELFELRMLFYNNYPDWAQELYIDRKSMITHFGSRLVKLMSFWLRNKIKSKGRSVYRYEEELLDEADDYLIENGLYVLDELLQYIPKEASEELYFSDWSGRYFHKRGLERATVSLIKKANKAIINKNPELFWEYYVPYMGKGYPVFNEIILQGFQFLPSSYSDKVISNLSDNLDKSIFDLTSGAVEQLGLVKEVIRIHTPSCSEECLNHFLDAVEKYVSPRAAEWYKDRIDFNREKNHEPVYWSFWGDLQYQLLTCVADTRLSEKQRDLLNVFERKFKGSSWRYINGDGHFGGVKSPVSGKKLSKNQWLQIITNKKLENRKHYKWKEEKGCFIESTIETYSSDFNLAVKDKPIEMINLALEHQNELLPYFINSLYSGAEFSEHMNQVEQQTWENMFKAFPVNMDSQRASYFCGIIEKTKIYSWSKEIIAQLKDIALNYKGIDIEQKDERKKDYTSKELYSKSLNCVRGTAIRAIGHLLWENAGLFEDFKDTIDAFVFDGNPVIRMASFHALWPAYNIDREWAETRLIKVYESDVRMAEFYDSKNMFFYLYPRYGENVLSIINSNFPHEFWV